MSRLKSMLVAAAAVIGLSFAAFPAYAAEANRDIQVVLEGQNVAFEVPPRIEDGTTLVQFRPIFERLGLTISWDEQQQIVKGKNSTLSIELQIGNDQALVNGQSYKLAQTPKIINDSTVIPLRFVGEVSGKDVHWDAYKQSIWIASAEDNIKRVVEQNVQYSKTEDLNGTLSLVEASGPLLANTSAVLKQVFAIYDLEYLLNHVDVKEVKTDTAVVITNVTVKKMTGPEFKDNRSITTTTLHKINGSWKIGVASAVKTDFLNADKYMDEKPAVSDADRKAILQVIEDGRVLSEKEDFDAYQKLFDKDYPNLENVLTNSKYLAASYDLKFTYSNIAIIQAKGDTVTVRYTASLTKVSGPAFNDTVVEGVDMLRKQPDGSWKVYNSDMISTETIQPKQP